MQHDLSIVWVGLNYIHSKCISNIPECQSGFDQWNTFKHHNNSAVWPDHNRTFVETIDPSHMNLAVHLECKKVCNWNVIGMYGPTLPLNILKSALYCPTMSYNEIPGGFCCWAFTLQLFFPSVFSYFSLFFLLVEGENRFILCYKKVLLFLPSWQVFPIKLKISSSSWIII